MFKKVGKIIYILFQIFIYIYVLIYFYVSSICYIFFFDSIQQKINQLTYTVKNIPYIEHYSHTNPIVTDMWGNGHLISEQVMMHFAVGEKPKYFYPPLKKELENKGWAYDKKNSDEKKDLIVFTKGRYTITIFYSNYERGKTYAKFDYEIDITLND